MKKYTIFTITLGILISATIFLQKKDKRDAYALSIQKELKEFKNLLPEEDSKEKALGQPNMAALQDYYQTMDPEEKRVPQERLVKAQQEMKAIQAENSLKNSNEILWENISSNMGGRTRSLMWDPNSNSGNRVWAGSVTGGIWYNEDITFPASSWHPVDDFMASLSISSLAYDPNNTQTFYAGTGEAPTAIITYRESSGRGVGIWKSTNGGSNWELIESTQDFAYITDLEVKDENGQSVIYAGVASGIYKGSNHQSIPTDGLYRSTDGGESWEQVLPNITGLDIPYTPASIEFGADGRIYVGSMRNINGDGGACLLYSDEGTAGSWNLNEDYKNQIEAGMGDYSLAGRAMISPAPSNENIVYAIVGAGYLSGFGYYHGNFVLKSTDKGENWEEVNIPNNDPSWASLSWHAFVIAVDPNDENHFYVGGLDEYHSLDGGNSYTHVSDWAAMYYGGGDDYLHADQHAIEFKPGSSNEAIFGTDGGVFYTNNATQSYPVFTEVNRNYSSLQFYTCDIKPTIGSEEYLGGLQDNGTLRYTGDDLDINDMILGGDGAYCLYDDDNPNNYLASYYYNRYTVFNDGNEIGWIGNNSTGTFVSPADLDDEDNILYANGVGFFGQGGNSIFRVKNYSSSASEEIVNIGTFISTWFTAVTNSPYDGSGQSTLFVGSNDGHLFKVEDAQDDPVSEEIGSDDFPTGAISCVAIGGSEDTLLVTFSNYGVSSIWQSYNGGDDWLEVESNLPDMPIRWALYHPHSSKQAMIATELGVWVCYDLSASEPIWMPAIDGMANVRVDMLAIRNNDLAVVAASHGRGLFTTTFNLSTVGFNEISESNDIDIYPNPSNGSFSVDYSGLNEEVVELKIFNINGQLIKTVEQPNEKIFLDLRNHSEGIYVLKLKTSFNNHYAKKITIQ